MNTADIFAGTLEDGTPYRTRQFLKKNEKRSVIKLKMRAHVELHNFIFKSKERYNIARQKALLHTSYITHHNIYKIKNKEHLDTLERERLERERLERLERERLERLERERLERLERERLERERKRNL